MANDLDSAGDDAKLAESKAFRRLIETPDLDDWHEALGAWLRAVRKLQRDTSSAAASTC
jgi:hypothetical protein